MSLHLKLKAAMLKHWPVRQLKTSLAAANAMNIELENQGRADRQEMLKVLREVQEWKARKAAR